MTQQPTGLAILHEDHVEPERPPTFLRPGLFPDGPAGPWQWPALERSAQRHEAAVKAIEAAREAGDAEAERAAKIGACDAVVDGCHGINATLRSARSAYRAAVDAVRAELPLNAEGVVPSSERRRYSKIVREAAKWSEPDARTIRRCMAMAEPELFLSGRAVARIVAEVEEWRAEQLGEAEDLGEATFEPAKESEHDVAA